jgi:membrane protein implicated in regulation of membrane protease activity
MSFDTPATLWAIIAIGAAVAEIATPHFGVIFVSLGAVAGCIVAFAGGGLPWQLITFAVVLGASLRLLRPPMANWLRSAPGVPTRTAHLIGKRGVVTQAIDPALGTGRVTVGGEDWAARSTGAIAAGVEVRVVGADGIVLEVQT